MKALCTLLAGMVVAPILASGAAPAETSDTGFGCASREGMLLITHAGQRVGDYVYRDSAIPRPYFANLRAPGGIQVTRNHPPREGEDLTDHETFHPGVWLAFGDLSGQDSWRNKAAIRHEQFTQSPTVQGAELTFATESRVLTAQGQAFCKLELQFTVAARPAGYLLIWDAVIEADKQDITFGDQEEMGLGIRVATPIIEKNGGAITSSTGQTTAQHTWGKAFDWCDYSGAVEGRRAGVTLMPDPANFRPSWFHNRDYGLMVANPFGRHAMRQGEVSSVLVKRGEKLRLRFGLLLYATSSVDPLNLAAAYQGFLARSSPPEPAQE